MTDLILEQKIKQLQARIISWAKKHKVWRDSGFKTYFEHFNDEPSEITACVTVMWTEGELYDILNCQGDIELLNDFDKLIDETEFWYEFYDSTTLQFYCKEDELIVLVVGTLRLTNDQNEYQIKIKSTIYRYDFVLQTYYTVFSCAECLLGLICRSNWSRFFLLYFIIYKLIISINEYSHRSR